MDEKELRLECLKLAIQFTYPMTGNMSVGFGQPITKPDPLMTALRFFYFVKATKEPGKKSPVHRIKAP